MILELPKGYSCNDPARAMRRPSIIEIAMGREFSKLHPMNQKRLSLTPQSGVMCICRGVMNDVWVSKAWVKPFLKLGATRHILFPESARNVPFTAENFSYLDALGRETYAWVRTYHLPDGRRRRFDGYMVYSPSRGCMIEYFGTHQHLVSDLEMVADARGGICVRSRAQRFFEHFVGFKIPPLLTADGEIRCWFEEASNLFRIEMRVWHRRWGQLLGQSGTYTVVFHPIDKVPPYALPKRVEARE